MKKEEAVKYLQQLYPYGGHCWLDKQRTEAIGMAIKALQEEPVSEDLKEAIDTYLATYFGSEKEKQEWPFLKKMAIHFAEWQKQKDSIPISEELEKELNRFLDNTEGMPRMWHSDEQMEWGKDIARHFANWQREQMMKDAISAKVTEIYYPTDSCLEIEATLPESRFKDGDKVLIIKKD